MRKAWTSIAVVVALLVIFLMLGPFYIVNEGYQAVVTRFGQIVSTRTNAGLYIRIPVVDVVTTPEEQEESRKICESLGATLRVRPYEE